MKNRMIRFIAVILCALSGLAFGAPFGGAAQGASQKESGVHPDFSKAAAWGDGFQKALANESFELLYDHQTAQVGLRRTGEDLLWYSNPQDIQKDPLATEEEKNKLASQILVSYIDKDKKIKSADSFTQSVNIRQHSAVAQGDTLFVEYFFGKDVFSKDILPSVISKTRMEGKVLARLSEEERDLILSRYDLFERDELDEESKKAITLNFPSFKKHDIYVLSQVPEYVAEELYECFQSAGYTLDDLQADCDDNDVENKYSPAVKFKFLLGYTLNENGFSVTLHTRKTQYDRRYPPVRFDLLPYFGCADNEASGFMLVPDGSGSLISLNNKKTRADAFWMKLFNHDRAVNKTEEGAKTQLAVLPVFALSSDRFSYLAEISEGYECAGIKADIADKIHSYNTVGAFFDITPYDNVSLNGNYISDTTFIAAAPALFSGNITLSYHLEKPGATYSDFAGIYRRHLKENNILPNKSENPGVLSLELIGAAQTTKKFLGIPYQSSDALTTYDNASDILDELGAGKVPVRYANAVNGGSKQKFADKIKPEKSLGGKSQLEALQDKCELSFSFYAQTVKRISNGRAARSLANDSAKQYAYNPISRYFERGNVSALISGKALGAYAGKIRKTLSGGNIHALNLKDIGYELNSDFNKSSYIDRKAARMTVQDYLKELSRGAALTADYGSYFSLPYVSRIWDIPMTHSGFAIEDQAVPFYAMVVRGSVDYCAPAVNLAYDARLAFLDAVSVGAGLQYSWVYENKENTVYNGEFYYNREYQSTLSQAKAYAAQAKALYGEIAGAELIFHDTVQPMLTESRFSNGVKLLVNRGESPLAVSGYEIGARDFLLLKGD